MASESVGGISWVVDADTSPATNSTQEFGKVVDFTERRLKKLDTTTTKTARGVNSAVGSMGRKAGQAGIQIQQFVGQIQGGQNAMLALSAQSADLGFVLGAPLVGAIVGISASLAGFLLPALFNSGEATEELTEKMKELVKVSTLTQAQSAFLVNQTDDEIKATNKLIKEQSDKVASIKEEIAIREALAKKQAENTDKDSAAALQIAGYAVKAKLLQKELTEETAKLDTLNGELDESVKKRSAYQIATEKSLEQQEKERKGIAKVQTALQNLEAQLGTQVATMAMTERGAAHYKATLLGATSAMHEQIDAIYDHKDALKLEKEELKASTEEEKRRLAKMKEVAEWQAQRRSDASGFATGISDRGLSEADTRREEQTELQSVYDEGLISEQAYQDALTQIRKEGEAERVQSMQMTLGSMSSAFGDLSDVFKDAQGEQSTAFKAMFALSKGFAIAQAGLNLALSISQASAAPWPANLAAMASAAASGAALVSSISSAAYGGRENGGSVLANQAYEVGEKNKPEMLMIPGNNGKVFSNSEMKSMMGSGGGGSYQPVINNYAAADGYQVQTRRDELTKKDVFDIVQTEMTNPNSKGRRGLQRNSNVHGVLNGGRRT